MFLPEEWVTYFPLNINLTVGQRYGKTPLLEIIIENNQTENAMIRNDQMVAIIFNELSRTEEGQHAYKGFNTEKGEFINVLSEEDIEYGVTITLGEELSGRDEKTPRFIAGDNIDYDSLRHDEQDYVRDTVRVHTKCMKFFEDAAGGNGRWAKLRTLLSGNKARKACMNYYRAKPQGTDFSPSA